MIMNKDEGEEFWVKGMNQIFNRTIKEKFLKLRKDKPIQAWGHEHQTDRTRTEALHVILL